MDLEQALGTLDGLLPAGATASWFAGTASARPASAGPGGRGAGTADGPRSPSEPVARLLAGLAELLVDVGGDFAEGGTELLLATPSQTVLVHRVDGAGAVVIEAGKGLNLALVRRLVTNVLEGLGEQPVPAPPGRPALAQRRSTGGGTGAASTFPRRTPPPPVTDFRFVPEDAEVLRMLEQALST